MDAWTLPGFEVGELLGFGATGEVWRATETATGETVALKRLRADADPAAVQALRREATALASLDTPYIVRLRQVVGDILVLDHAPGGSLAALLSRRGDLQPGEVVTVAAPLAAALAAAHAVGLVHGDLSPSNVLFTADGMPLLSDLGLARFTGERVDAVSGTAEYVDPVVAAGGPPGPASDVWALAAICHHMLAGSPPHAGGGVDQVLAAAVAGARAPLGLLAPRASRSLVAVVEAALSADPSRRPTAEAFATALQRAQAPAPVRLAGAPPVSAPVPDVRETHVVPRPTAPPAPTPARRRRRPSGLVLGCVVLVLGLLAGGLVWARSGEPAGQVSVLPVARQLPAPQLPAPQPPTPQAGTPTSQAGPPAPSASPPPVPGAPAEPAWGPVLDGLDRQREQAFAQGAPALLERVWVAGSTGATGDAAALATLISAGRTAWGVRHEVRALRRTTWSAGHAELRVTDVLTPQVLRDAAGSAVQSLPGRGEAAYDVVLVQVADGWRIAELTPG